MSTPKPRRRITPEQRHFAWIIVVLAVVNVAYRLVYASGAQRSAALFVGIPALLAIGLALTAPARNAIGMLFKGSTLAVLVACVVLPEGLVCLLFVLPLIVIISLIVGGAIEFSRSRNDRDSTRRPLMAVGFPLLLLSMEGVVADPVDSHDAVVVSIVVDGSSDDVARRLAATPTFESGLPGFLRLGFNRPIGASGEGLAVGDIRTIHFTGGDHDDHPLRIFGGTGERSVDHHSEMRLRITEVITASGSGRVVFTTEDDSTMLAKWARLERSVVTWCSTPDGHTSVTWRIEYERLLTPSAYFGPLQRLGMSQAARYLLDSIVAHP